MKPAVNIENRQTLKESKNTGQLSFMNMQAKSSIKEEQIKFKNVQKKYTA